LAPKGAWRDDLVDVGFVDFPVSAEESELRRLAMPTEGDTRLAPPVPVTLSLTALSGIGNLVTGAALLVLLTWWVRHIRKGRRQRAAEAATTLTDS